MSKRDDGGPVYPHLHESCQRINETEMYTGMTMRQFYKGMALAGIRIDNITVEKMAEIAAAIADALIHEDREAEK